MILIYSCADGKLCKEENDETVEIVELLASLWCTSQ